MREFYLLSFLLYVLPLCGFALKLLFEIFGENYGNQSRTFRNFALSEM